MASSSRTFSASAVLLRRRRRPVVTSRYISRQYFCRQLPTVVAALLCRKARSGRVIKELEQMCEKTRSFWRRAAAAAVAAAVPTVPPSVRPAGRPAVGFHFAPTPSPLARRRRLINLK